MNNLEHILPILKWENKEDFYFCMLLLRKKEHKELGSNSRIIKTYYIKSEENLLFYLPEMIKIADVLNGRIYFNLNRRNFKRVAFYTMKKICDQIMNEDFSNVMKAYNSSMGSYVSEKEKKWVVDIDGKNVNFIKDLTELFYKYSFLQEKLITSIPTKNGWHLITTPFNLQEFNKELPLISSQLEIKKDGLTLLYCPE